MARGSAGRAAESVATRRLLRRGLLQWSDLSLRVLSRCVEAQRRQCTWADECLSGHVRRPASMSSGGHHRRYAVILAPCGFSQLI